MFFSQQRQIQKGIFDKKCFVLKYLLKSKENSKNKERKLESSKLRFLAQNSLISTKSCF